MHQIHNGAPTPPLWAYSISFILKMAGVSEHYHRCYKIVVSQDNAFQCLIDGTSLSEVHGLILNQAIPYTFFTSRANVLVCFVEANSDLGHQLKGYLAEKAFVDIENILPAKDFNSILPPNFNQMSNEELVPYVLTFLRSFMQNNNEKYDLEGDTRVRLALEYIDQNLQNPLELEQIADLYNVSSQRAGRFFIRKMRMPFSQYVLWQRIRKTMAATNKISLKEACKEYGFSGPPQFEGIFKRLFGIKPMEILREGRFLL